MLHRFVGGKYYSLGEKSRDQIRTGNGADIHCCKVSVLPWLRKEEPSGTSGDVLTVTTPSRTRPRTSRHCHQYQTHQHHHTNHHHHHANQQPPNLPVPGTQVKERRVKRADLSEFALTNLTLVRFDAGVDACVLREIRRVSEALGACGTLVGLGVLLVNLLTVDQHVGLGVEDLKRDKRDS